MTDILDAKVGDWVIRSSNPWDSIDLKTAYRITERDKDSIRIKFYGTKSSPSKFKDGSSFITWWYLTYFRFATPMEIFNAPIKNGDWITNNIGYTFETPRDMESPNAFIIKHATPYEYRNAIGGFKMKKEGEEPIMPVVEKKEDTNTYQVGDLVHPNPTYLDSQRAYRVAGISGECVLLWSNNVHADIIVLWHKNNVRPATKEEIKALPVKAGDWVHVGSCIKDEDKVVYELFEGFLSNGLWVHITPEKYRAVLASNHGIPMNAVGLPNRVSRVKAKKPKTFGGVPPQLCDDQCGPACVSEDEPLDDSRDELSNEIDAVKLEATLGDHENRLNAMARNHIKELDSQRQVFIRSIDSISCRVGNLEKGSQNPCGEQDKLATVYRCRLGKNGRWVRTRGDYVDKLGRGEYTCGNIIGKGANREQPTVRIYPEALEPVPTTPEMNITTEKKHSWEQGRSRGLYECKDNFTKGMRKGIMFGSIGSAIATVALCAAYYTSFIL